MRIISYNVNGIRAAINKGFIEWLATNPADVICLQETKAQPENIDTKLLENLGYTHNWFSAQKKGYSGVAIFSKQKPDYMKTGTGHTMSDDEGRVIQVGFGDLQIINAYFPSGTTGDVRQTYKHQWLSEMHIYLKKLRKKYPQLVLCGDYNIAHKEIDIHDPKGNKNCSGFLPEERAWLDQFLDSGWVDTFRHVNKDPHQYSWWSQRFPTVRQQNKGWRIDYITVTQPLQPFIKHATILPDVKHSDHCPVYLELQDVL